MMIPMKNLTKILSIGMILLMCSLSLEVCGEDTTQVTPKIDLVFVIDTTGSMSDEIREVKMHIQNIIEELRTGTPTPDVAVGFVIYRDYPDQESAYVFHLYPLSTDIDTVLANLEQFIAAGGGDEEETVTIGLDVAINEMNWRTSDGNGTDGVIIGYDPYQNPIYSSSSPIKRVMFLIGDAPPRTRDYQGPEPPIRPLLDYTQNIKDAQQKNITIYTISCSGMNDNGIRIWQEIANKTGGNYEQLTYERRDIEQYVEEEKLDESWVGAMENSSDYDASTHSIVTNSLGDFVRSSVLSEAKSMGIRFGDEIVEGDNIVTLPGLGSLIDQNNDSIFDVFHNTTTGRNTTVTFTGSSYLLDVNGDGRWEYSYTGADGVVPYQESLVGFESYGIVLLFVVGLIVGIALLLKRK